MKISLEPANLILIRVNFALIVLPYSENAVSPECSYTVKSKCCKFELGSLAEKYTKLNEEFIKTATGIVTANGGSLESVNKTSYPIHVDDYADSRLLEIFVTPKNNHLVLKMGDFEDNLMIGPPFYLPAEQVSAEQLLTTVCFMLSENKKCYISSGKTCSYAD